MADRRMFSKQTIDSDAFLDMPLSTQSLYFHLSMRADDEGFVNNPKKIQRMIGAADDDLKVLVTKNFIIPFDSGIVVIKHWRIHNYLRSDRFKATAYREERAALKVKENGAYTLLNGDGIPTDNQLHTNGIPDVSKVDTQYSIDKDSIEKNSIDNTRKRFTPPTLDEVKAYCKERNNNVDAVKFFEYYKEGDWHDGKCKPVKNWKQKLLTWEREDNIPKGKVNPSKIMDERKDDDLPDTFGTITLKNS